MLKIRVCEESLVDPIIDGAIRCPVHLCSGEEAVAVGICAALEKTDYVFGNHRSHGHFIAKGGDVNAMVAEIFGKETGCSRGRGGSMHLIDPENGMLGSAPIVAGTISLAMGSALSAFIRGSKEVAVSFFGDGATDEGVLYESLNFAALKKLPMIFVCENNYYATHMAVNECRPDLDISKIAEPFGISNSKVDGNNVLEVYKTAKEAVAECRSGNGPYFIEALTYRLRGHVGPDDNIQGTHTDIRPEEEIKFWKKKDPIKRFKKKLISDYSFSESEIQHIHDDVKKEILTAHEFAASSPYPAESEIQKYVFKQ
jgi:pyruvate dehydrogenase E1 component alpha subunit